MDPVDRDEAEWAKLRGGALSRQIDLDDDKPPVLTIGSRDADELAAAATCALKGDIAGLVRTIQLVTRYTQEGKQIPLLGSVTMLAGPPGPMGPTGAPGPPGPPGAGMKDPGPRNTWTTYAPFLVRTQSACYFNHDSWEIKDPTTDIRQLAENEREFRHQMAMILNEIIETMNAYGMTVNTPNFYCYRR